MKRLWKVFALALALVCLAAPARAGLITSVAILTSNGGIWQTGAMAAIGISDPGSTSNPFYNDLATGAIVPATGISSGTYLAFLGYEYMWPPVSAELIVYYADNSSRSATFQVGSLTALGNWTLLSGDTGLTLGGGGFTTTPDRVGTSGSTNIVPTDGIPDVVLQFSDSGAPEPATFLLVGAALAALGRHRRRLS